MSDPTDTGLDAARNAGTALRSAGEALRLAGAALITAADAVEDLGTPVPPAPELLVSGPPWPADAVYRGVAPWTVTDGATTPEVEVVLRPRTQGSSSSDGHDVHVLLARRVYHYTWQLDIRPDVAMLDALTWKVGGMVAFDGNWSAWPGGGTSAGAAGSTNAMERLVGQNTSTYRSPTLAGWGVYCTFPTAVAEVPDGVPGVQTMVGGHPAWVTNRGHTCHWEIPGWPVLADRWTRHTRTVDVAGGTLVHSIAGKEALELTGLPWAEGFNRVYQSFMIGGSDPEFLPRTGDRTGRVGYRSYRLWAV